jgi:2-oxoglutarate ferredoxin oxidoreductase subunit alpha
MDGSIGQMMEPAELPPMRPLRTERPDWAITGAEGRPRRFLTSIYMDGQSLERANLRIQERWLQVEANEVRYKEYFLDDAEFAVVGFGSAGRIALTAVRAARAAGIKVGLLRPITLSPFPEQVVYELSRRVQAMLVVEMNTGQMLDDVRAAVRRTIPVEFFGRLGGLTPFPDEVLGEIQDLARGPLTIEGHPRQRWLKKMANIHPEPVVFPDRCLN